MLVADDAKLTFEEVAKIVVPSREQFRRLIAAIGNSDGNSIGQAGSKEGADLVEFLAYSGARVGESRLAAWSDVRWKSMIRRCRKPMKSLSNLGSRLTVLIRTRPCLSMR